MRIILPIWQELTKNMKNGCINLRTNWYHHRKIGEMLLIPKNLIWLIPNLRFGRNLMSRCRLWGRRMPNWRWIIARLWLCWRIRRVVVGRLCLSNQNLTGRRSWSGKWCRSRPILNLWDSRSLNFRIWISTKKNKPWEKGPIWEPKCYNSSHRCRDRSRQ